MKLIAICVVLLQLTGCAGLLAPVGNYMDGQDPCQFVSKPRDYKLPDFCGAGKGKTISISKPLPNTYQINRY